MKRRHTVAYYLSRDTNTTKKDTDNWFIKSYTQLANITVEDSKNWRTELQMYSTKEITPKG